MAQARAGRTKAAKGGRAKRARRPRPLLWLARTLVGLATGVLLLVVLYAFVPVPFTQTMWSESRRLGGVERSWVGGDDIAPVVFRSVVAAEDANFCLHWGFDMAAIRDALDEGAQRGASTISQQTVKNVFLWQGRSWPRKAMEAVLTPVAEAVWTKRRMLVIYLNVAEFGEGVFGVEAAARHYWGVPASALTPQQAARLAVVLPNPKGRDPTKLGDSLRRRAQRVADGAETIRRDGRAACFES